MNSPPISFFLVGNIWLQNFSIQIAEIINIRTRSWLRQCSAAFISRPTQALVAIHVKTAKIFDRAVQRWFLEGAGPQFFLAT